MGHGNAEETMTPPPPLRPDAVAVCVGCGHSIELHGRRGHGACRHRTLTEHGRAECDRLGALDEKPEVIGMVWRVAVALPGMTETCDCRRFRKGRMRRK